MDKTVSQPMAPQDGFPLDSNPLQHAQHSSNRPQSKDSFFVFTIFYLVTHRVTIIHINMIKSFAHKGLEKFYESGSVADIQPMHAKRLRLILASNWRLTFRFEDGDVHVINYADYH